MSAPSYYVAVEGQQRGPISKSEVLRMIQVGEISDVDHIFDGDKNAWVKLFDHPEFASVASTQTHLKSPGANDQWFVLRGENKFGPFRAKEVVKLLQQKAVFEYDLVWTEGMKQWEKLASVEAFAPEAIRQIFHVSGHEDEYSGSWKNIFFPRKYIRHPHRTQLVVHNNESVFSGTSLEVGAGGCGFKVARAVFKQGEKIYIHFRAEGSLPSFNVVGEVVGRRQKDEKSGVIYNLKFIKVPEDIKAIIEGMANFDILAS